MSTVQKQCFWIGDHAQFPVYCLTKPILFAAYAEKAAAKSDVALQLPTGSGKTLVGLILAEWRRRKYGERVVYLCPTRQLVHQVTQQAKEQYGLRVNAFVKKKSDYDPTAKSEYLNAETVAIAPYSALFNTNPFFSDPQAIILDDAHSAESYIAGLWSVRIERFKEEHAALYTALISAMRSDLAPADYQKLISRGDSLWEGTWVEKMPTPIFEVRIPEVISIIDAHSSDLDIRYAWSMIRDHLHGCHFYVDARSILIRPLLPPTNTHPAFELATQRIYMSATLGAGGELERLAGRREIVRLTVPAGWDKHGIGRRFFVFPERSLDDAGTESFILKAIQQAGRALVLVPDELTAKAAREWIQKEIRFTTFEARDIEMSKKTFIETSQAVAVVASRYDGIDFPGKECRMLVVAGLPRATNLQERFFITRMGALALLNDRILTRIVQAFGRCTRSATDFAGVIIWGEELHGYLLKRERRDFLHPELQAELEFGIDQSKGISETEFLENLSIFFEHQDAWNNADAAILKSRDALIQKELPGTADLRAGVQHEIDYQYAIWRGDFPSALEACRRVLAELKASDLRGYRAIWNYLAGSAAWMAYKEAVSGMEAVAREYFRNAVSAAPGVRWLVGLSRIENFVGAPTSEDSRMTAIIERLERVLEKLGTVHDRKYAEEEKFILEHLAAHEDGRRFEAGHERLGKLLGYEAGNVETKGAPDPWWMVDETIWGDDTKVHKLSGSRSYGDARELSNSS